MEEPVSFSSSSSVLIQAWGRMSSGIPIGCRKALIICKSVAVNPQDKMVEHDRGHHGGKVSI